MKTPSYIRPMIFSFAFACMVYSAARADLCVLKHGEYTLNKQPCTTADGADGAEDGKITLVFEAKEDIEIDIVFQQDPRSVDNIYEFDFFNFWMYYDLDHMLSPMCNPDPLNYFNTNMNGILGVEPCAESGYRIQQAYMNLESPSYFPTPPEDFILDQLTFGNGFPIGENLYTIEFDTTGAMPTEVGVRLDTGDLCGLLTNHQECEINGIPVHTTLETSISVISSSSCYTAAPSGVSVTCKSRPGCSSMSGSADLTISLTPPSTCWADTVCSAEAPECANPAVKIYGIGDPFTIETGEYVATADIGESYTVSLMGVSDSCNPSSSQVCGGNGLVTFPTLKCICDEVEYYSVQINLEQGWNLVTVPVNSEEGKDFMFSDKKHQYMIPPNDQKNVIRNLDDAEPGRSYWLFSETATSTTILSTPPDSSTYSVTNFNRFGAGMVTFANPFSRNDIKWANDFIKVDCGAGATPLIDAIIKGYVFQYLLEYKDGGYNTIENGDYLYPWKGYFIYVQSSDCSVIVCETGDGC